MRLNEGLEKLGDFAFYMSAIESITLPSTLKRIEALTFSSCNGLRNVEIPNGVEYIGKECFADSKVEEIMLPCTLREIGEDAFNGCKNLKTVLVEEGCALSVKRYVNWKVKVRQK